jgi:hypothetical protein
LRGQLPFMIADCGSIGRSTVSMFMLTSLIARAREGARVGCPVMQSQDDAVRRRQIVSVDGCGHSSSRSHSPLRSQ